MSESAAARVDVYGLILQGIGGSYTVETADGLYTCRPRGIFRREGVTPTPGDHVGLSVQGEGIGTIETVEPRKNVLVRPPVANLDCLVVVISPVDPSPNLPVIDRMIALAIYHGIAPAVVVNKTDLADTRELTEIYQSTGLPVFSVSALSSDLCGLRRFLCGKVCAFTGNSGVGKSSLLNRLMPELALETGEISRKLGRGRHTTRAVRLYPMEGGGYLADTPGFSFIDLDRVGRMEADEIEKLFPEFSPYLGKCRFAGCAHVAEKDCAVRQAAARGEIAPSRYQSYVSLYREIAACDRYKK